MTNTFFLTDVKKTILASYKEKCVIDGVPPNDLLVKMLEGVRSSMIFSVFAVI